MDDESEVGEGAQPPSEQNQMRRRRSRRVSAVVADALGELAFVLYQWADARDDQMLKAKLLAWRGAFLPRSGKR